METAIEENGWGMAEENAVWAVLESLIAPV
jgi:hypothetical protein